MKNDKFEQFSLQYHLKGTIEVLNKKTITKQNGLPLSRTISMIYQTLVIRCRVTTLQVKLSFLGNKVICSTKPERFVNAWMGKGRYCHQQFC